MKQKIALIVLLILCCIGGGVKADFNYDDALLSYKYLGQIHTFPNDAPFKCNFEWHGGDGREIIIASDNMPDRMFIRHVDFELIEFGWDPNESDIGTYYINFTLSQRMDPNTIWTADYGTVVVKVEEWINPPVFEGIGACRKQ